MSEQMALRGFSAPTTPAGSPSYSRSSCIRSRSSSSGGDRKSGMSQCLSLLHRQQQQHQRAQTARPAARNQTLRRPSDGVRHGTTTQARFGSTQGTEATSECFGPQRPARWTQDSSGRERPHVLPIISCRPTQLCASASLTGAHHSSSSQCVLRLGVRGTACMSRELDAWSAAGSSSSSSSSSSRSSRSSSSSSTRCSSSSGAVVGTVAAGLGAEGKSMEDAVAATTSPALDVKEAVPAPADGPCKESHLANGTATNGAAHDAAVAVAAVGGVESDSGTTVESGQQQQQQHQQEKEEGEQLSQAQLIWRAVKLPLYSVALIPLMVGAAAAYCTTGQFHASRFWSFLLHSVLVIAWLNLSNDGFDAGTGVDKEKKESVVNMTGSRVGVLVAAFACLALGLTGLLQGALAVGDTRVFGLLAAAIACGYVYQCPPFRLSYKGLGEPLCFVAFGPLATTAFYLYQASNPGRLAPIFNPTALAASLLVGATTTLILFCSHFHQIEGDLAVGKMSPLVRLGTQRGAAVVRLTVFALYLATAAFCACGALPFSCLPLIGLTAPIGYKVLQYVVDNHANKSAIFMAKYFCVRLHVAMGFMLATGLRFAYGI